MLEELDGGFGSSISGAQEKNSERQRKGGHNVPDSDVVRRFSRGKKNFMETKKNVSYWELYYNGESGLIFVASGKDSDVDVVSDFLYNNFIGENYG